MFGLMVAAPRKSIVQYCPSFRETEETSLCVFGGEAGCLLVDTGLWPTPLGPPRNEMEVSFLWYDFVVENINSITSTKPTKAGRRLGRLANIFDFRLKFLRFVIMKI
jgi:hypothetical protein